MNKMSSNKFSLTDAVNNEFSKLQNKIMRHLRCGAENTAMLKNIWQITIISTVLLNNWSMAANV